MKLLVGLGNPGEKYAKNRHNAGFMFVDFIREQYQKSKIKNQKYKSNIEDFKYDKYLLSEVYELQTTNYKLALVKPQTFMNRSGEAVKKIVDRFTVDGSQELFVVHDDLDIPFGQFKIQKVTGPKLHNGIESVEKNLKTKDFWRVRIGVDNRAEARRRMVPGKIDGEAYVLSDFSKSEREQLENVFPRIIEQLERLVASSK